MNLTDTETALTAFHSVNRLAELAMQRTEEVKSYAKFCATLQEKVKALELEREDLRQLVDALTRRVGQLEPKGL